MYLRKIVWIIKFPKVLILFYLSILISYIKTFLPIILLFQEITFDIIHLFLIFSLIISKDLSICPHIIKLGK